MTNLQSTLSQEGREQPSGTAGKCNLSYGATCQPLVALLKTKPYSRLRFTVTLRHKIRNYPTHLTVNQPFKSKIHCHYQKTINNA